MSIGSESAATLLATIKGTPTERAEMADAINALNTAARDFDLNEVSEATAQAQFALDNAAAYASFKAAMAPPPVEPPVEPPAAPSSPPVDPPPIPPIDVPTDPPTP